MLEIVCYHQSYWWIKKEKTNHWHPHFLVKRPWLLTLLFFYKFNGPQILQKLAYHKACFSRELAGPPSNSSTGAQLNQILTKHCLSLHSEQIVGCYNQKYLTWLSQIKCVFHIYLHLVRTSFSCPTKPLKMIIINCLVKGGYWQVK